MKLSTLVLAATLAFAAPAIAGDAPPPDKPHTVALKDSQLQLIAFMAQRVGKGCDGSEDGKMHCIAQVQAADLIADINKQITGK